MGPSPVSLGQFEMFLKANSIDQDSIELIKVGFEGEELLIKGEIDALDAVSYAIPRTINKGFDVDFLAYIENGLPDSPFLVFAAAETWALNHKELLQGFYAALSAGLHDVEAWQLADWERYTEKLPDRNAPEEFAVWKRILPAISNGRPFQLDLHGLKVLMENLRSRGVLKYDYDLQRFFFQ